MRHVTVPILIMVICPLILLSAFGQKDEFADEERKDRYELLKMDQRLQENLPEVIDYFKNKQADPDIPIQATTHQQILKLCQELSEIVAKIIEAKADKSVSDLMARQR